MAIHQDIPTTMAIHKEEQTFSPDHACFARAIWNLPMWERFKNI